MLLYANEDVIRSMVNVIIQKNAIVDQDGEETSAISVSHIRDANMDTVTVLLGNVFVTQIGEESYVIKI